MDQMLQLKDTDWLNVYKNKAYIYAVYKRPNLYLRTHTDLKQPVGRHVSTVFS